MTDLAFDSWLGHLPPHWIRARFGQDIVINEGQVDPTKEPWSSMVLIAPNHIESGTGRITSLEDARAQGADSGKYRAKSGQVLYSKIRPALNKVAIAPVDCLCSADMYPISGRHHAVDNRFLAYWMLARPFASYATLMSDRVKMPKINREEIAAAPWARPPLDEQRRIADFLDAETARIDQLAALQRSVLRKLGQRDRAVRDSLIDRLADGVGELPLRRYSIGIEQGSSPSCENHPRELGEWGVLKLSAVKQGRFYPDENKQLPTDIEPIREYEVHDGDLLVTRANTPELVGDVAVASGAGQRLLLPDLIYRVGLDRRISPAFVAQVLLSSRVRSLIQATARGSSQSMVKLRGEDIQEWPVPKANPEQQAEVVRLIDDHLRASDKLRATINRQLALLIERRQALITAAVTGGITV